MKYIFVSGGVVSGLGKGITTASLAFLLKSRGYKVTPVKVDMYFNVDAGTLRPQEHGEVFVTHDGMETDEDLGHYERFVHEDLKKENYITAGQVYGEVIRKERAFEYGGDTVDVIPHVTDEIIRRIKLAGEVHKADVVIVEFGGTVGEYKNGIFFEASRILKLRHPKDVIQVHVTYLPYLANVGELKSKPAQTSVHVLNGLGIQPDILIARSQIKIDKKRLDKIAMACNISEKHVFSIPDLDTIYEVPILLHTENHHLASTCLGLLSLKSKKHKHMQAWKEMTDRITKVWPKTMNLCMVGKYFATGEYQLEDSYVSVIEALKHAGAKLGVNIKTSWIDTEDLEKKKKSLEGFDGIIVPQGWGSRGVEGKLIAAKFARENNVPYLGLCFGMQMACIEFARNVLKMKDANTTEADPDTKHPIIHIMEGQKEYLAKHQYGGTIRLGAYPCAIKKGTLLHKIYGKDLVSGERHRHRYEFNNEFKKEFEKAGFVISGTSPDGKLVEAIEIKNHKFFVGTQFHPEYISRPLTPHPIFVSFLEAVMLK
ncbi:MAG TPA: CTP synthase [Alphaproteobacteria bacterium]|nr:CTP synthase [Alphaproteobacteria bacterium]